MESIHHDGCTNRKVLGSSSLGPGARLIDGNNEASAPGRTVETRRNYTIKTDNGTFENRKRLKAQESPGSISCCSRRSAKVNLSFIRSARKETNRAAGEESCLPRQKCQSSRGTIIVLMEECPEYSPKCPILF